jgi:transposase
MESNRLSGNFQNNSQRSQKLSFEARNAQCHFYLLRTGCGWRHLPHDLPPWKSVYTQFRRWKLSGLFGVIHDHLRKELRILLKRAGDPSAGIVDSQSVKTTEKGAQRL